jgi:predicted GNAT superfamily acetyltransferase
MATVREGCVRLVVDIPRDLHRTLKIRGIDERKQLRELTIEALSALLEWQPSSKEDAA